MKPSTSFPLSAQIDYPLFTETNKASRRYPTPLRGASFGIFLLSTLAALGLAGCATSAPHIPATTAVTNLVAPENPPQLDSGLLQSSNEAFTLGPGDKLEIEFIGDPTSRTSVEVGPDGKIYFYLLPGIDVWGMTLPQTKELIADKAQLFMKKKQGIALTLRSVGSKHIWILGHLNSPGIFSMSGPITLLEAIAQAGGPTPSIEAGGPGGTKVETADLRRSFILRHGQMLPVDFRKLILEGDLSQNIYLQPDDFVYLPSATAQTVHVLGAVAFPRAVISGGDLTLIQTIANAGGTVKYAYLSHVAIVRGSLTKPTISIVDYNAVLKGTAPDVLLEPHDIVYVPYSPYRTLTRYTDLILETFVRTVGVNEGARAITGNSTSVGVNVQVGN